MEILIWRDVSGIARGRSKGTGTSSARKTVQWTVFSEMGPAGPWEQGTGKAARETIQPGQKKRYRDIVRRGIPENPVAATRS